jgi:3-oxo-5alpha-steroid 4-dehydrogenase
MFKKLKEHQAYIEKPITLSDPDNFTWDKEVHLVIAGFGGAGAATALEAHEQGLKTLVLDRMSGGGATTISGGIYYAGGGTTIQEQTGAQDSPENMFNYLQQEVQGAVSDETLKKFCDDSVENFDWITKYGVPFDASLCPYKTSYPSNKHYFYYSGNESFPPYSDHATPAPRGHRAHQPGISGKAIFEPLRDSILKTDIEVQTQTKVVALINNDQGEVIGLKTITLSEGGFSLFLHKSLSILHALLYYGALFWPPLFSLLAKAAEALELSYGKVQYIRASKGVVLATGGFFSNQTMVKKYAAKYQGGSPIGTMCDDGSGIQMAQGLGAKTALMDRVAAWRFINPPSTFSEGILVGLSGKRICNEMLYGAQVGDLMMQNHDGKAWLILDAELYKKSAKDLSLDKALWFQIVVALSFRHIGYKKANTLEILALQSGIEINELVTTVNAYNAIANSDQPDPMGKPKDYITALTQGPFYALNVSYDYFYSPCASLTFGGLVVNEQTGLVKNDDGSDIKGLYAVGRTAVGIPSKGYVSGLSIADCIFSGRRAAKHAASK